MSAITASGPGQLIRWHYFGYSALALVVMTAMARFVSGL
jgi:hypothetical protein